MDTEVVRRLSILDGCTYDDELKSGTNHAPKLVLFECIFFDFE